ncbi:MAG: FtsH protease activity modulator HflK [Chloroflexi bacterium]|nr:MAG: FtsH protease activity modulator HflK [Chloroflexota bacterium]
MHRKERTIFVTIVINLLLILFKFGLANASGSLALRASAVHSVTDAALGGFVLLGLLLSRWEVVQRRTRQGVTALENWLALVVAVAIFSVGFDIVREVLLRDAPDLRNLTSVTVASLLTVAVAYFIARYKLYVGRQTESPALIASGYHSQMDIYAALVVVAGLAGGALGLPNLDRVAAAVVVVFIFLSGYEIGSSALAALRHHQALKIDETHVHAVQAKRGPQSVFLPAAAVLLLAMYGLSGAYIVAPGEAAVVRRLGRVVASNVGPGLHYRLPWPMERVDVVPVDAIRRVDRPANLMLTGDENLISVRFSLHYTVTSAAKYLLNSADPDALLAEVGEAALRQVIAQETVDALLTVDKAQIERRATTLAQASLDRYDAGLRLVSVQLLESSPPPEVADAFRDVASAREDRNTFVNEAAAYRNEVVPLARGEAQQTFQAANAYAAQKIGQAGGDATQFTQQQAAYAQAPEATRLRLYLEAAERILPGVRKFVVDDTIELETTDLWVPGESTLQTFPVAP